MRIQNKRPQLFDIKRGSQCFVMIDGRRHTAFIGETVATALLAHGRFPSSVLHARQPGLSGYFCGIGLCYGCQVMVNGQPQRACVTPIQPEMTIATSLEPET